VRPLLLASSFVGLAAVACWGASRPAEAPHAVRQTAALSPHPASVEPAPSAPLIPLDLREFQPVLGLTGLESAREAVDTGRPRDAANLVLARLAQSPSAVDQARLQFTAGALFSQAGEVARARQAFLEAAKVEWPLRADAWLRAAESFMSEAQPGAALAASEQAHFAMSEPRQRLVEARAYAALDRPNEAAASFRALLHPGLGFQLRMEWVRLQVQQARRSVGDEQLSWARAARLELAAALVGLPAQHPVAVEGGKLEAELGLLTHEPVLPASSSDKLAHLSSLIDQNALDEALEFTAGFAFTKGEYSSERCQFDSLTGKLLSLQRKWGEAAEKLGPAAEHCTTDTALHARLLFNAGKYSAADGRDAKAVRYYAALERLYADNSLADDARLRSARSYKDMGAPARFVELLTRMPEDYPDGDMTWEGVLELALYQMERKDWASAALVLESGARAVQTKDAARGQEFAGCERYFLARTQGELGKKTEELDQYEAIVRELPLSYYMLHAYSRLAEVDPKRAESALLVGQADAAERPFSFAHRAEFDTPEFGRGLELLRVGELSAGQEVLGRLKLGEGADQSLLWGLALLYDRAGDAHVGFGIAQGRLTDWLSHYPSGDWERPWQIGFPRPYYPIVRRESLSSGVPEWFIYGIMREESTFDPSAESPAAAYGLMQLIVPTARAIGKKAGLPYTPQALKQPHVNIALGSRVLSSLARQFPTNPWLAIPGYNAGPGRPKRWLRERPDVDFDVWVELIPFRETRRYTKRVLASRATYAFLYAREQAADALLLPRRLTLP